MEARLEGSYVHELDQMNRELVRLSKKRLVVFVPIKLVSLPFCYDGVANGPVLSSAMSGSLNDMATPSFSYSEFIPVKPRKKRRNRQEHRERPSLSVLLQRTRDEISNNHSQWFSQCQSPSSLEFFALHRAPRIISPF